MTETPQPRPADPFASLFEAPPLAEQERMIEALLFAAEAVRERTLPLAAGR